MNGNEFSERSSIRFRVRCQADWLQPDRRRRRDSLYYSLSSKQRVALAATLARRAAAGFEPRPGHCQQSCGAVPQAICLQSRIRSDSVGKCPPQQGRLAGGRPITGAGKGAAQAQAWQEAGQAGGRQPRLCAGSIPAPGAY